MAIVLWVDLLNILTLLSSVRLGQNLKLLMTRPPGTLVSLQTVSLVNMDYQRYLRCNIP